MIEKNNSREFLKKLKIITHSSVIERILEKKGGIRQKELQRMKIESLKLSVFIGLFFWLIIGVIIKNTLIAASISIVITLVLFFIILQIPLAKKASYAKRVEADLPIFLMRLSTEIKIGKSFSQAISDSCKENGYASIEFKRVLDEMHKGASFSEALQKMNERLDSITIRRVTSNLSNLNSQGIKDVSGIKKVAGELLIKQRIESKEFSGKMVIYALVFIALSAIVPAMFQSFVLIGSYFMKIDFSAQQIFLISIALFPTLDLLVLFMINSKTPVFLRQ